MTASAPHVKTHQPRRMLITGGAGFIGSNFIQYLLKKDNEVEIVNLDQLTYAGSLDNLKSVEKHPHYHFVHGNILDRALLNQLFQHYLFDTVVHFAAESHVDRSIHNPMEFMHTNVIGTTTLLETAKHYWMDGDHRMRHNVRFHHISTDEVYGSLSLADPAFTETSHYQPRSPYSASKAASDHLVHAYHHTYGLPFTLSNCSNNYGPQQHQEKFIPTIIRNCLENTPIPVYGNGSNVRDWLYVEDHCHAIWLILQYGKVGSNYNIGGQTELSNLDLTKKICLMLDQIRPETFSYIKLIQSVADRPGHDFRYAINFEKIKTELQWTPEHSLTQGLKKTLEYYLAFYKEAVCP